MATNGNGEYRDYSSGFDALEAPVMNAQDKEIVANLLFGRGEFLNKLLDPRRDIDVECGYPTDITSAQYKLLYEREPIATRVVEVLPKESWQHQPTVYEDEDSDTETAFELAWDALGNSLRGNSWYQDEEGSPIWEALKRLDILSGIGAYGVMLLGFDDGKPLSEPVDFVNKRDEYKVDFAVAPIGTDAQYNRPLYDPIGTRRNGTTVNDNLVENQFCNTGPGGGVDPTCSTKGGIGDNRHVMIERLGQIGMVTEPGHVKEYKKSPGDFTLASQAAVHYAKKNKVDEMLLVPGNSNMQKVFHIAKPTDDITGMGNAFVAGGPEQSIAIVKATGEVYQAKATRRKLATNEGVANIASAITPTEIKVTSEPSVLNPQRRLGGTKVGSSKTVRKLLFVRSFDESLATISQYDGDVTSPRFGQPVMYNITLNSVNDNWPSNATAVGLSTSEVQVHWTRIIHVADNLGSSEIFGVPRMRAVFNRLCDLRKLYGGSAEMYWRGAFPGLSFESNPQLGGDVKLKPAQITQMRDQVTNYFNGLQRYLTLVGMSAKTLAPMVVDPTPQIKIQLESICILLGIPMRIFMGSERGELASGQDDSTWNGRLKERHTNFLTPRVIIPFVDRMIAVGVLPTPEGFSVVWPDLDSLTDLEQADLAVKRTDAISKYVGGGCDAIVDPMDYLTRFLGFNEEEAETMLEAVTKHLEEAEPDAETIVPGRPPKLPEPEAEQPPVKMKEGEALVSPKDGTTLAKVPGKLKKPVGNKGDAKSQLPFEETVDNKGANCGIASGGFQKGNVCAKGGSGGDAPALDPKTKKQITALEQKAAKIDQEIKRKGDIIDPAVKARWKKEAKDARAEATKLRGTKKDKTKSSAKVEYTSSSKVKTKAAAMKLMGKDDDEVIASIVGATDDAKVSVAASERHGFLNVSTKHPDYTSHRIVNRDESGVLYVENMSFIVDSGAQGKGLGTDVFSKQVKNAQESGVGYIKCHAAKMGASGKADFNGFYTWPRLGYDSPIPSSIKGETSKLFPEAKSVLDVMETKQGRDWWKTNGVDLPEAKFDLSPGSRSMKIMDAYLAERKAR